MENKNDTDNLATAQTVSKTVLKREMNMGQIVNWGLAGFLGLIGVVTWAVREYDGMTSRIVELESELTRIKPTPIDYDKLATVLVRDHANKLRGDPGQDGTSPAVEDVAVAVQEQLLQKLESRFEELAETAALGAHSDEVRKSVSESQAELTEKLGDLGARLDSVEVNIAGVAANTTAVPSAEEVAQALIDKNWSAIEAALISGSGTNATQVAVPTVPPLTAKPDDIVGRWVGFMLCGTKRHTVEMTMSEPTAASISVVYRDSLNSNDVAGQLFVEPAVANYLMTLTFSTRDDRFIYFKNGNRVSLTPDGRLTTPEDAERQCEISLLNTGE